MSSEDVEPPLLSLLLDMLNCTATLEHQLSFKVAQVPENVHFEAFPNSSGNMCPYKEVLIKVWSIFGALAETLK